MDQETGGLGLVTANADGLKGISGAQPAERCARFFFGGEDPPVAKVDTCDGTVLRAVVPRFELRLGAPVLRRPPGDRPAQQGRDFALRHSLLQPKQFVARDRQSIGGNLQASQRLLVFRVMREHGTIQTDGVVESANSRQILRELDLELLPDLSGATVVRVFLSERADRIGVDLFVLGTGVRRDCRGFVFENIAPLLLMVRLDIDAAACGRQQDEDGNELETFHCDKLNTTRGFLDSIGERS